MKQLLTVLAMAFVLAPLGAAAQDGDDDTEMTAHEELVVEALNAGRWPVCSGMGVRYIGSVFAYVREGEGEVLEKWVVADYGEYAFPLVAGDSWGRKIEWVDYDDTSPFSTAFARWTEVVAFGVEVTTPAGTFTTCHLRSTPWDESAWFDTENNILVAGSGGDESQRNVLSSYRLEKWMPEGSTGCVVSESSD